MMRYLLLTAPLLLACCVSFIACRTDAPRTQVSSASPSRLADTPAPYDASRVGSAGRQGDEVLAEELAQVELTAQPEELGEVQWLRDFERARELSRVTRRPLFVLFTEVPGCSTVKGFAREVLTHPLLVEAIEAHFVPVVVYNNVEGEDREVLRSFKEPTWNNPVVRLMNAEREPLARRFSGPYELSSLIPSMVTALSASQLEPPAYLSALGDEARVQAQGSERAVFSMYCFWSGEVKLGGMTAQQASRVNAALGRQVSPLLYLSDRQIALHTYIVEHPEAGWRDLSREPDLRRGWEAIEDVKRRL